MIPGDDHLGPAGECTFHNALIRLVLDYVQSSPRLDDDGKVRQKYGDVGELFGMTRKFARQDAEQLIQNGLGYDELILFLDDASQCRFAAARPRKPEPRRECWSRRRPSLEQIMLEVLLSKDTL